MAWTMRLVLVVMATMLIGSVPLQAASAASVAKTALNSVLPNVKLDNVAISEAIDFLRDVSGANIHVNWRALEAAGVGKDAQVNIRLNSVPLRKVLDLALNEAGAGSLLTFYVDQGVIEVTTRELADKELFTRVYPIEDLIIEIPDFVAPEFNLSSNSNNSGSRGGGGGGGGSGGGSTGLFGSGNGSGAGGAQNNSEKIMTRAERAQAIIDMITSIIQPDIWQVNGGRSAIRFFNGSLIVTAPRSVHEGLSGDSD